MCILFKIKQAQPIFRDPKRFPEMADPLLKMQFPERNLNQAVGIAAMCLQDEPSVRPLIGDVVTTLSFLTVAPPQEAIPATLSAGGPSSDVKQSDESEDHRNSDSSDHDDAESEEDNKSNSDSESNSSWVSSDHDDVGVASHQRENSPKLGKKSSSSKHKDKVKEKHDNTRFRKQGSRSHKKNADGNKGSISFTSSSSGSSHHSSRSSATGPHGSVSANLRVDSIEESQAGSIGSSTGRGRFEESFSWSIGSSSIQKSRSESAHLDSGSNSNEELHNISGDSNARLENSMRSKNGSIGLYSRQSSNSGSEDESYSARDYSDDEIEHESKF